MRCLKSRPSTRRGALRAIIPPPVVALAWLLSLVAGSPVIRAQETPQVETESDLGEQFFAVLDVEIVNIDVWVTDKRGKPVEGLGKEDFAVYRDGQPVEVTNFYAVSGSRPAPGVGLDVAQPAPVPDPAAVPRDASGGMPQLVPEVAPEHRLWLIVYIDNYNIDPIERNRILPALLQFLSRTLRGNDQAMIVSYNRSLKVQQPFTDRMPLLTEALAEIKDHAGQATVRRREQISTLRRIDKSTSSSQALSYAKQYAEEQMNGVDFTIDALGRLIDTLGGLPGRKALLYVSSGVPMAAGEEMFHVVADKFNDTRPYSEIPRHDTSRRFERINRSANAHRVVFHTLDAGGLRGMEFGAAEYGGFVTPSLRTILDSVVPQNLQSPLRLMALETGGRTILNRNEVLPALEEVASDFRSFYSLGISSGGDTGRYHEIKVKFSERRKDLRLRHRSGYRSKDMDARVRESLRSALLYAHQANPLKVQVRWGAAKPHSDGRNYLLPIQLDIPLRDVVLLPGGVGKHEARLRLYVGAVGKDGEASEIDDAPLGIRLANEHVEAAKNESLVHTHQLLLSPGRKKVGVAILDVFGSQSSVVTRFIEVGSAAEIGPGANR